VTSRKPSYSEHCAGWCAGCDTPDIALRHRLPRAGHFVSRVPAGFFSDTLDFGGGTKPLVAIMVDAFVAKIDASGHTLWADRLGYNGGPYEVSSMAIAPDGELIIAGTAGGSILIGDQLWTAQAPAEQPFIIPSTRSRLAPRPSHFPTTHR